MREGLTMYFKYLEYVLRHKYFVFKAGLKTRTPIWLLVIHDWSKFLPSEFGPYAQYFYGPYKTLKKADVYATGGHVDDPDMERVKQGFDRAWLLHWSRNPHHWQHWLFVDDLVGDTVAKEMPEKYVREMVSDWSGAGRAITGTWELNEWYERNQDEIFLHPQTRTKVEALIASYF